MKISETEAIILNTRDYGESDRLVSLYTRSRGRLQGIAKGARRSRKRFANTLEPCSLVELHFREKGSLVWLESCKLVEPFLSLRTEVVRWGFAALVSEIVMEMVPEGDPQPESFELLKETLHQLCEDKDPLNVVLLFIFRFQDNMGYLPALESCGLCGRSLRSATKWYWQMERGLLACSDHPVERERALELDLGTLLLIGQCRSLSLDRIWRLRFLHDRKVQLFYGLLDWVRGHIRKELKSLKLLEQVHST
jgi:DNA repair protein RecO (recombination protein O)